VAFDDILSAARRGFINALNRFDGAFYGTRLSTYATVWIKQACQQVSACRTKLFVEVVVVVVAMVVVSRVGVIVVVLVIAVVIIVAVVAVNVALERQSLCFVIFIPFVLFL
jgi:diacylglycerol kinase